MVSALAPALDPKPLNGEALHSRSRGSATQPPLLVMRKFNRNRPHPTRLTARRFVAPSLSRVERVGGAHAYSIKAFTSVRSPIRLSCRTINWLPLANQNVDTAPGLL